MTWLISTTPQVVAGIQSFGFTDPTPDQILEFVESYLSQYSEQCAQDRWPNCPDDYFVYSHVLSAGGQWHTLEFVVRDTSKQVGVLEVVWVEHYPGPSQ